MNIPSIVHMLLIGLGVAIAVMGTLGMFGFGSGERMIALGMLALVDDGVRRAYSS
jgi:hypothetical protein